MRQFLESEIRINKTPKEILEALLSINHLKEWWGISDGYIEAKDGGLYTLIWNLQNQGIQYVSTGRIRYYDRRTLLHLEDLLYIKAEDSIILGPFTVNYDIAAHQQYSILSVKQGGFTKEPKHEWYWEAARDGWPKALVSLKTYLEST